MFVLKVNELLNQIYELKENKELYNQMYATEQRAFLQRKEEKESYLRTLKDYENELQSKYKKLHENKK